MKTRLSIEIPKLKPESKYDEHAIIDLINSGKYRDSYNPEWEKIYTWLESTGHYSKVKCKFCYNLLRADRY